LCSVTCYDIGLTALFSLQNKSRCKFLSPLKILRPLPGLNQRSLCPMARTPTSKPQRATSEYAHSGRSEDNVILLCYTRAVLNSFLGSSLKYDKIHKYKHKVSYRPQRKQKETPKGKNSRFMSTVAVIVWFRKWSMELRRRLYLRVLFNYTCNKCSTKLLKEMRKMSLKCCLVHSSVHLTFVCTHKGENTIGLLVKEQ
jgi:hypothetical protein